jgi:hypothetical protein
MSDSPPFVTAGSGNARFPLLLSAVDCSDAVDCSTAPGSEFSKWFSLTLRVDDDLIVRGAACGPADVHGEWKEANWADYIG